MRLPHVLNFLTNRELDELYASVAIRSFALAVIDLFIPIYFLTLGYALSAVFYYYVLANVFQAVLVLPAAKLASHFGFKHAIFYSVPLFILFFLALFTLESSRLPLALIAFLSGAANAAFWLGYHVDFAKASDFESRGREIGFSAVVATLFTAAGPLAGGLLIVWLGFPAVFLIVSALLFVSALPLFYSQDIHEPINFSARQIFTDQKFRDYAGFAGHGVESAVSLILWPVFLFMSVAGSLPVVGSIRSLSILFSALSTVVFSGLADWKRILVLRFGALGNAAAVASRALVGTIPQAFFLDGIYGITKAAVFVPFDATTYDRANQGNIVEYLAFREIIWHVGQAAFFALMFFLADFTVGFLLGGAASLLIIFF